MDFSDNIHQQSHGFLKAISISKAMDFSDNIHQQSHGILRQYPSAQKANQ
jgi:hypothetical protein